MLLQIVNMSLRAVLLISKLLVLLVLAKRIPPEEVGIYGLLVALISYSIYLVGLDFYVYSTRELLKHRISDWGGYLKSQMILSSILYCVVVLFSIFLFDWNQNNFYWVWFVVLLVLEYLNQEVMRLLVAASKPVLATIVLFFRSGLWSSLFVIFSFFDVFSMTLMTVIFLWSLSCIIALLVSFKILLAIGIGGWKNKINKNWVFKGIKVCLPLLAGTLSVRAITTIDKYWLEYLTNLDVLGAYILFFGLSGALLSFVESGVFSFLYPKMILAFNANDNSTFSKYLKKMVLQVVIISLIFIICSYFLVDFFLNWINKSIYIEYKYFYWWLLLANILNCMGNVFHYALYAKNKDKDLVFSNLYAFVLFVLSVLFVMFLNPTLAIPIGLVVTFLFMLVYKLLAYKKYEY